MTDERLEELGKLLSAGTLLSGDRLDLCAAISEILRLRADNEAMQAAFADRCQDEGELAGMLRLAREAGRLEALRRLLADREPALGGYSGKKYSMWYRGDDASDDKACLPGDVFDRLEGGTPIRASFAGAVPYRRDYPDEASCRADLANALAKLARDWPAEG